jgi:hypothetical protein
MAKVLAGTQAVSSGYYDPDSETDPLVRKHIAIPSATNGRSGPYLFGASGHAYPVWSVYLSSCIANGDIARAIEEYGSDLSPEQIRAAIRFAELYPDVVGPYVEPHLRDG